MAEMLEDLEDVAVVEDIVLDESVELLATSCNEVLQSAQHL